MWRLTPACAPTPARRMCATWWWSPASQEAVLRSSEQVSTLLHALVDQGELAGFESPSRYLPERGHPAGPPGQPPPDVLEAGWRRRCRACRWGRRCSRRSLPNATAARTQPLLQPSDLEQTSMATALQALLIEQGRQWSALLPLKAPKGAASTPTGSARRWAPPGSPPCCSSTRKPSRHCLVSGYLREASVLSLGGLGRHRGPVAGGPALAHAGGAHRRAAGRRCRHGHRRTARAGPATDHPAPGGPAAGGGGGLQLRPVLQSFRPGRVDRAPESWPRCCSPISPPLPDWRLLAFSNVSILQAMGATVRRRPGVILALI